MHEYNDNMNGVDRHAQMVSFYVDERTNLRYWVAFFVFILMASVVNAFRMHKIRYGCCQFEVLTHEQFRRSIAIELISRSDLHRKRESYSKLANPAQDTPPREHTYVKTKIARCQSCKNRKDYRPEHTKRRPLDEISGNVGPKRSCVSQTTWKCGKYNVPCCRRKRKCWIELHSQLVDDEDLGFWDSGDDRENN